MSNENTTSETAGSPTDPASPKLMGEQSERFQAALASGFELGNRYSLLSVHDGNRGLNGTMFRQRAGASMEFLEHRDYQPGDDLRHIDWSVMAKRDQVYVKCFEQESTPVLDLVLDHSISMNLQGTSKAEGTLKLLAAIYAAALAAHFHVKIWLAGAPIAGNEEGGCFLYQTPTPHPASWPPPHFSGKQHLADAFRERAPVFRPNGYRILISDLLFDADPVPTVQQFSQQSQTSIVIQVLSSADVTPPSHGSIRIIDSETGATKTVFMDAELQRRYSETLQQHQSRWIDAANRNGTRFVPMIAEDILARSDLRILEERQILVPA